MSDTKHQPPVRPAPDDSLVGGQPSTLFGDPIIRGATHHCQSIKPVATVPSSPIKKRRRKNWWKHSAGRSSA